MPDFQANRYIPEAHEIVQRQPDAAGMRAAMGDLFDLTTSDTELVCVSMFLHLEDLGVEEWTTGRLLHLMSEMFIAGGLCARDSLGEEDPCPPAA